MKTTAIIATIFLMLALCTASVSAVELWFLDSDGDGLVDDVNGDGVSNMDDVVLLHSWKNFIANNYPDMLPMFDYNRDGVTDIQDLDYAYYYVQGRTPSPVLESSPSPVKKPNYYISVSSGSWYPNGERAVYNKTPSITIGWNPEDAPKISRPVPQASGIFPPLKRWG